MITLENFQPDNIIPEKQIAYLGQFLIENFEDEISNEGAIGMAVRLLLELKEIREDEECY